MTILAGLVEHFRRLRVVVVGDVILDEYLIGRAVRLSREAPVPVLEFEQRQLIPGGAANPAVNTAALGAQTTQVGLIGADAEGEALEEALRGRGVTPRLIVDGGRGTTVKTRVLAHMGLRFPQQVARLDRLSRAPLDDASSAAVGAALEQAGRGADVVLYSDYQLGLITPALAALPFTGLRVADSQGSFEKYSGFDAVKCNADEASAWLGVRLEGDAAFAGAAQALFAQLKLRRCMVITRGADGATVADAGGAAHCPAPATSEVYDTVGAGDTAVAMLALALAAGAVPADAVRMANAASGLVVRRVGNYAPGVDELSAALAAAESDRR
jgi:rfaE bifunctional protein kinase chain/domain